MTSLNVLSERSVIWQSYTLTYSPLTHEMHPFCLYSECSAFIGVDLFSYSINFMHMLQCKQHKRFALHSPNKNRPIQIVNVVICLQLERTFLCRSTNRQYHVLALMKRRNFLLHLGANLICSKAPLYCQRGAQDTYCQEESDPYCRIA